MLMNHALRRPCWRWRVSEWESRHSRTEVISATNAFDSQMISILIIRDAAFAGVQNELLVALSDRDRAVLTRLLGAIGSPSLGNTDTS